MTHIRSPYSTMTQPLQLPALSLALRQQLAPIIRIRCPMRRVTLFRCNLFLATARRTPQSLSGQSESALLPVPRVLRARPVRPAQPDRPARRDRMEPTARPDPRVRPEPTARMAQPGLQ